MSIKQYLFAFSYLNAAVQHENMLPYLYYLSRKITTLNRSDGTERVWLTKAGQQAAGGSVAMVKKTVDRLEVAVLQRRFNYISSRPFLCKDKHELQWWIKLKLWATVVL